MPRCSLRAPVYRRIIPRIDETLLNFSKRMMFAVNFRKFIPPNNRFSVVGNVWSGIFYPGWIFSSTRFECLDGISERWILEGSRVCSDVQVWNSESSRVESRHVYMCMFFPNEVFSFFRVRCSISAANVIFPVRAWARANLNTAYIHAGGERVHPYVNKQTSFVSTYDASRGTTRLLQLSWKLFRVNNSERYLRIRRVRAPTLRLSIFFFFLPPPLFFFLILVQRVIPELPHVQTAIAINWISDRFRLNHIS